MLVLPSSKSYSSYLPPRGLVAKQKNVASCEPVSLAPRFHPMTDWSQATVGDHFQSIANDPNGTDKAAPNLRLPYGMSPEFSVDALQQTLLEANLARLSVLVKNTS
jgi:hypothetical protein